MKLYVHEFRFSTVTAGDGKRGGGGQQCVIDLLIVILLSNLVITVLIFRGDPVDPGCVPSSPRHDPVRPGVQLELAGLLLLLLHLSHHGEQQANFNSD
jgi:hypothetical protein